MTLAFAVELQGMEAERGEGGCEWFIVILVYGTMLCVWIPMRPSFPCDRLSYQMAWLGGENDSPSSVGSRLSWKNCHKLLFDSV